VYHSTLGLRVIKKDLFVAVGDEEAAELERLSQNGSKDKKETECVEYDTKCVQYDTECVEDATSVSKTLTGVLKAPPSVSTTLPNKLNREQFGPFRCRWR